ncbi:MAG: hypothetical protein A2Y14_04035 [Verrucomicrobia bacterium GWF2_51_19]|nr:MAG: hypothetical protein A2Y14_04035 [Verrucomicrobia bacterium GWF2_51_19]
MDAAREGILDMLQHKGYSKKNTRFLFSSADNQKERIPQLALAIESQHPDLIISISTPVTQVIAEHFRNKNIPIVFSSVTDAVAAHIVPSAKNTGHITGVQDIPPIRKPFRLIKEIIPQVRTIGILYSEADVSSCICLEKAKKHAAAMRLALAIEPLKSSHDIEAATERLVKKADVLFILPDNHVCSHFDKLIAVADKHNIPVFSSVLEMVKKGALAAYAHNEYDIGQQAGLLAARILNGESASSLSIYNPQNKHLFINPNVAKRLHITFPQNVLQRAVTLSKV